MLRNAVVAILISALPVAASVAGDSEGCTPGYWKNHADSWQEYSPTQTVSSVFSGAAGTPYANLTLMQALSLKGGPGVAGAQEILLRAAVASLLNAADDSEDGLHLLFPWRRDAVGLNGDPPLISTVNATLASGSRATIIGVAARLDAANNLGCPLD